MRSLELSAAALLAAIGFCLPAMAQTTPAPATPAPAAPGTSAPAGQVAPDPVVARVNGKAIYLSEVQQAASGLPEQYHSLPPQMIMPMLVDQLVDGLALADEARKQGIDRDPAVKAAMEQAADQALQNALLRKDIGPTITEAAIKARYERDYANKPGEKEVHARHILVATEAAAQQIIAQLQKGADFATIAKQQSTDTGSQQNGGDLGWFKEGDMLPEFSKAAFALQPGQFTQAPVHTQYGWHVIQVLAVRNAPPETLEAAHDEIRQKLIQEGVQKELAQARADAKIERFNLDGSPARSTDTATPPPAPAQH
jgi:peptidyl-prolyl cis-trans isomerase C